MIYNSVLYTDEITLYGSGKVTMHLNYQLFVGHIPGRLLSPLTGDLVDVLAMWICDTEIPKLCLNYCGPDAAVQRLDCRPKCKE